jgi:hypothetical protein
VAGALRGGLPALLAALLIGAAAPPAPLPVILPAVPPAEFAAGLAREPARLSAALAPLARALASSDGALSRRAADYLAAAVRARQRDLAGRGVWTHDDVLVVVTLQLVDPERFVADAAFRRRVLALLPRELDPQTPAALRDAQLAELNQVRGFDFAASEEVERAWGAIPRRAAERRLPFAASGQRFDADVAGRLAASVYSLPSFFFDLPAADAFLSAVRAAAPERTLVVLTDSPLREGLAGRAAALHLHLLDTYGRAYSPWPRDPFTLVHSSAGAGGAVRVLVRPNLQPGREEDLNLGPELVRGLPAALDRAWGKPTWSATPMPFHNGQVLLTPAAAWMTLHALEPRILQLLGLGRVPVESFATAAGIDRYLAAAGRAAGELATLYGRPVRFVHPLPETGELAARSDLLRRIGGGAGYDLDSIVTFVPVRPKGKTAGKADRLAALVADVAAGRDLLARATAADLEALRRGYGLEPAGARLAAAQATPAVDSLAAFLDLAARHLASQGMEVRRLPVLTVPVALLRERTGLSHPSFLLTWNNVVVESPPAGVRAEGFSSLLPAGDRAARDAFGALGVHLDLFPPLVRSVVLNGGYRCASNHLRTGG